MDTDTTGVFTRGQRRKRRLCYDGIISKDDNSDGTGNGNFQIHVNNLVIHYRNVSKGFVYIIGKLVVYSSQVFMTARILIIVFWTIISYTITDDYKFSKGTCCLLPLSTWTQQIPPKWWLLPTLPHVIITKISVLLALTYVPKT